jgi:hypothetical protein
VSRHHDRALANIERGSSERTIDDRFTKRREIARADERTALHHFILGG